MVFPSLTTRSMRQALLLAALALGSSGAVAAEPDMFWFKNDIACDAATVTVRSFCEVAPTAPGAAAVINSSCTEQEVQIAEPGKRTIKRDLLAHEPVGEDFHTARSLRCVAAGKQRYLLISLATGGNCDTCEIDAILGFDGKWKRQGRRWLTASAAEQRSLRQHQAAWQRQRAYTLTNTVREPE